MSRWVEVDCGHIGYDREHWVIYWYRFMRHFFDTDPPYDYNGSKVYWAIDDESMRKTMTTVWNLKDEGYRTSYQNKVQTFFWVDKKFYKENKSAIFAFAERYNCKVPNKEYGWIEMPNKKIELLFRMQWAGKCYG